MIRRPTDWLRGSGGAGATSSPLLYLFWQIAPPRELRNLCPLVLWKKYSHVSYADRIQVGLEEQS
jgi:hypothetical protein